MNRSRREKKTSIRGPEIKPAHCSAPVSIHSVILLTVLTVVVAFIVLVTHLPVLSAQALLFDDNQYLTNNVLVQNPSWSSAKQFLIEVLKPSTVRGYYQPLSMISLMFDYASGGRPDNLLPFHRTSLILHIFNTVLIIVLLHQLFGKPYPAAIAGLLFGVHPMIIEAIAWVGERKTLLATFFALWSLLLYVRYRRTNGWGSYAVCLVMYVLALMSKPTSTPLPVLFLLIDYWPIRQLNWKSVIEKIPFFVIAGISAYITIVSQREAAVISLPTQYDPLYVPLTLCHNIIFYLYKIVLPINLTSHYPYPDPFTPSNSMVLAGIIGTSLLIPILIISLWWTRALLTGWLIFFVAIFPSMGVIGFTNVIASNKFAYLPSIGLLMILVWLVGRFWHVPDITTRHAGIRAALIGMTLALVASEAVATRRHLEYWQDTEGLFRYMLNITPDAAAPHFSLATVLAGLDKTDEAIEHYNQALRITPNHLDAHYNLANALIKKRDIDGAIKHYREVLRIDPNFALAHSNIGSAMFEKGDTEKAIQHLTRALELNPKSYRAYYNLGNALLRQNRTDEAIQHYTRAIELNPNFIAGYKQLGSVLSKQGELAKAIRIYQAVIQHQPNNAQTHFDLGILFGRLGYIDAAIGEFNRTLQINPNHIGAQKALAVALAEKKRLSP